MAKILHRGNTDDGFMRGEGEATVIQSARELQQQLITIEGCGRICYRSDQERIVPSLFDANKFIRSLIKRGHESVIEHSSITVIFSNVSRGFTHEMVRHRLASFSQESTRFVDYDGGTMDLEAAELVIVAPPHWNDGSVMVVAEDADVMERNYQNWRRSGDAPQDVRQFLPIGIAAKIAVTANFREWRHIFRMRTQLAAHWEIRYIMCDLLLWLKDVVPVIFEDFTFSETPDKNGYMYTLPKAVD